MVEFDITITKKQTLDTKSVDNGISAALKQAAPLIQSEARSKHRYQSRTGNLLRATTVVNTQTTIKAYVDEAKAKYGKYIHDGFKSWAPDPFLNNAIESKLNDIDNIMASNIDRNLIKDRYNGIL